MGRVRRIALVILLTGLLTGCWSRRELTDVSFAGTMGIDWVDDQFMVSLNISSPRRMAGEAGQAARQEVWTLAERAESMDDALFRLDQILSRSLTMAHVRSIIFGEAMARRGIGPTMDYLLRSVEMRPTAWIGVTNGLAFELLQARPRQESVPSDGPLGYHDSAANRTSVLPARRLTEVANILQEEGIDLTLPLFRLGSKETPREDGALSASPEYANEVIFGGSAIFHNDRMVDWLSPDETRGHLWAIDRVVHGAIKGECPTPKPNQLIVFRLRSSSGKVETYVQQGKVKGRLTVKVIADANEIRCDNRAIFDGIIKIEENSLRSRVQSDLSETLVIARKSGSDFFGFGQALFRSDPQAFKVREENWREELGRMEVTTAVEVRVVRLGQTQRRFQWREPD